MQFKSSMNRWIPSKIKIYSGETPERQLPYKKEDDCEYPRWSSFAVLRDVKIASMVIMFQQARFQSSRLYKDHGWMMDVRRSGRRDYDYCIGPGSSIILFVQPFPQYLIKVGYGWGVRLSSLYWVGVCIMYVVQCKKKYVLKNRHPWFKFCVRVFSRCNVNFTPGFFWR